VTASARVGQAGRGDNGDQAMCFLVVELYALALHQSLEFLSCLRPTTQLTLDMVFVQKSLMG